ncbi:MAG TPA: sugar phosphate isomerase/epimerase family protein [Lacipirellulaceae bacterium]
MILGYNTNGFTGLDVLQAVELLHSIGYGGIAITLDQHVLNPFSTDIAEQLEATANLLKQFAMRCVIETGARFLVDPQVKHEPTLVTAEQAGPARRVDFLCRAIDIAAALDADCVSLWSGTVKDGAGDREAMDRLTTGLIETLAYAADKNVFLGFEPEPGMFIDSLARYSDLLAELDAARVETDLLRLTIDVGHLHCQGELPIVDKIRQWRDRLVNVHIEDMRAGVHEHLMFGEGEIDFPPVIAALREINYTGPVSVELTRHTHIGPAAARQAYEFLSPLI